MKLLDDLAEQWLNEAGVLESALDERGAGLYRHHAAELKEALREVGNEVLTLEQAAIASGYSESRLGHMIADGTLPQAGEKGRPRIRRKDLPSKPKKPEQLHSDIGREIAEVVGNIT